MTDISDLERYSEEFDDLVQKRYDGGKEEYGPLAFLDNDMFAFAYEEMADTATYMRFLFTKLRIVQEKLNALGIDLSTVSAEEVRNALQISSGATSFSPSKEVQGFLPEAQS